MIWLSRRVRSTVVSLGIGWRAVRDKGEKFRPSRIYSPWLICQ